MDHPVQLLARLIRAAHCSTPNLSKPIAISHFIANLAILIRSDHLGSCPPMHLDSTIHIAAETTTEFVPLSTRLSVAILRHLKHCFQQDRVKVGFHHPVNDFIAIDFGKIVLCHLIQSTFEVVEMSLYAYPIVIEFDLSQT